MTPFANYNLIAVMYKDRMLSKRSLHLIRRQDNKEPLRCVSFLRMSTKNNHNVHRSEGEECRIYAGSRVLTRGSSLPSATVSPENPCKSRAFGIFLLKKDKCYARCYTFSVPSVFHEFFTSVFHAQAVIRCLPHGWAPAFL